MYDPTRRLTVVLRQVTVPPCPVAQSYAVSDYRRSTAFSRDLMGWEIIHDDGQKQCTVKVGNVGGIIIRNRAGYRLAP